MKERTQTFGEQVEDGLQVFSEQVEDGIQTLTVQAKEILEPMATDGLDQVLPSPAPEHSEPTCDKTCDKTALETTPADDAPWIDDAWISDEEAAIEPPPFHTASPPPQTPGLETAHSVDDDDEPWI